MRITLFIDEQLVERARQTLRTVGKSLNHEIREHLQHRAWDDKDLKRDIEFLEKTSGLGKTEPSWKWNRDELYEERTKWPRA
jgi:hypothetical protein